MDKMRSRQAIGCLQRAVAINCSDLEVSCRFFSDVLGFSLTERGAGSVRLDGGDGQCLTLRQVEPSEQNGETGRQTGITIEVVGLQGVFESLLGKGAMFSSRPCRQPWGSVMVNLLDPDGNRIMLVQRRSAVRDWRQTPYAGDAVAA